MHIVIVVGKENSNDAKNRFSNEVEKLLKALRIYFGIKGIGEYVILIGSRQEVLFKLEKIFIEKRREDICLFYIGHGQRDGWPLDGYFNWELVGYDRLAFVFAGHQGRFILINDCCFAGAAKKAMERRLGDYLLIAAMPENEIGYTNNFLHYLLNDWRSGRRFFPGASMDNRNFIPVLEGNQNLQRLFFKIKTAAS